VRAAGLPCREIALLTNGQSTLSSVDGIQVSESDPSSLIGPALSGRPADHASVSRLRAGVFWGRPTGHSILNSSRNSKTTASSRWPRTVCALEEWRLRDWLTEVVAGDVVVADG
jgi:hypothetical protein